MVGEMDNNVEVANDGRKDEDGRRVNPRDYQVETAGSTGNDSWGHESHLNDGEVQHPDSRSLHD